MLMQAVDHYLAVRRAAGFALEPIERYLRHFARFATEREDTHVVIATAIDWASLAPSEAQRHYRLQTVVRFARFMAAEDPQHQIPPVGLFRGRRQRPIPYIFSDDEIQHLALGHMRLCWLMRGGLLSNPLEVGFTSDKSWIFPGFKYHMKGHRSRHFGINQQSHMK